MSGECAGAQMVFLTPKPTLPLKGGENPFARADCNVIDLARAHPSASTESARWSRVAGAASDWRQLRRSPQPAHT